MRLTALCSARSTNKFRAPHSTRQLLEAAQSLGFKTGEHHVQPATLARARFPCIAFLKGDEPRPAILARADDNRLLYFLPGSQSPERVSSESNRSPSSRRREPRWPAWRASSTRARSASQPGSHEQPTAARPGSRRERSSTPANSMALSATRLQCCRTATSW